jgi:thioredoxin-like negative regulator of GroEL
MGLHIIINAQTEGIQCVPTMVIFKNSKEIQCFVGLHFESALSEALKNLLK